MLLQKLLDWINEDPSANRARKSPAARALLAAPQAPLQIAQRSLPSPQRLAEIAADYEVRQTRAADEQYEAFRSAGYPNFIQWVESLVEKSATLGGRLLLLTFDNATGIVTAATTGPRQILPPSSYALPIAQSPVQALAAATANHFQAADFRVHTSRQENTETRLGAQLTPAYDCVDIFGEQHALQSIHAKRRRSRLTRCSRFAQRLAPKMPLDQ